MSTIDSIIEIPTTEGDNARDWLTVLCGPNGNPIHLTSGVTSVVCRVKDVNTGTTTDLTADVVSGIKGCVKVTPTSPIVSVVGPKDVQFKITYTNTKTEHCPNGSFLRVNVLPAL